MGRAVACAWGAIPTIAPYFLPAILQEFSRKFPKATLIVHENTTDALLQSCRQGEIDLAILALPLPAKYLEVEELFEEELLLALPPDHPLVEKVKIRLSDVDPYGSVSLCPTQRSALPVRQHRVFLPRQELVSLSHGVSMIPEMAGQLAQSDRRVYRSFTGRKPTRTVAVAWNPYRFQSRLLKAFRACLQR